VRNIFFIISFLIVGSAIISCDPLEEEITTDQGAILTFSTDTVLFDTILSSVASITRRMRIFNPNNRAVEISNLSLGRGNDSPYSLIVNGEEGQVFQNQTIFGNDSLLVLVEVLIDPQNEATPFLVKDSLVVESNGNQSDVKLVAYGQDAIFIDQGVFECDVTLTAGRPYVIRNFALVDTLCTLTMEPGTRVLMDNDAFLAVRGSLIIAGDTANPVIIRNTRMDERFSDVPGQWNGIFFLDGSHENDISQAIISNGQIGLSAGNPTNTRVIDLNVRSTTIENMSFAGIFSVAADITATNTVINNCGTYLVANFAGGNYSYQHCTFSNIPNDFIRDTESVQFSDFLPTSETEVLVNELNVSMENCIVWGGLDEELLVASSQQTTINQRINNNIIRSRNNWSGTENMVSTSRNFPRFMNINIADFRLDSLSAAVNNGLLLGVPLDRIDIPRDATPDIGAFEFVPQQ